MDFRTMVIDLCQKRCLEPDYADRKRVSQHNRAMDKLLKLQECMYMQPDHCQMIASELLRHADERVRISMATYCIKASINQEMAYEVLRTLSQCSKDAVIALDAKMCMMTLQPCQEWVTKLGDEGKNL